MSHCLSLHTKFSHTDYCKKVKTRQLENLRASSISFYIRIWRLVEKDTSILHLCWICECHLSACFFYMSCFLVKPLNARVPCLVPLSMFPLKRTIAAINCQELAQLYFSLCKETTTKTRLTLHVQRVQGRQQLFSTQCHSDDRAPSLLNIWMEIHWHHKNEIRSGGTR